MLLSVGCGVDVEEESRLLREVCPLEEYGLEQELTKPLDQKFPILRAIEVGDIPP